MSARAAFRANLVPCLGLTVGPAVWAANTQAGQILPYSQCGLPLPATAIISLAGALLSLMAGAWSWHKGGSTPAPGDPGHPAFSRSFRFLARLSGLFGLVFAFTLLLQGAASLWMSGCER